MKFSLIVPVYNTEQYLDKCLDSIFSNDYKNYEVIIVNDGTKDNSEEIINKYLSKYNNIIYIKQKNKGLSSARNEGVKKSTGDYILFIDSDDFIEKDLLSTLNNNLNEKVDLLRFQLREIYGDKVVNCTEKGFNVTSSLDAFSKIVKYKYIEASVLYAYNRKFYLENNFKFTENIYHEDFDLIPRIIEKAQSVKSISYIGYNYQLREESITTTIDNDKIIKKMNDVLNSFKKVKNKNEISNFYANSVIDKYNTLSKENKKLFYDKIKKLHVFDYFNDNTIKRKIKKIIYKIRFEVK